MAKTKKKRQEIASDSELQQAPDSTAPEEEPLDEEEEREEGEPEDVYAEDENDIAMIRKLEEEETEKALATIAFDEEVGFNPMFEWKTLPESEKTRFAALKAMSRAEVEAYAWKRLNACQKWMVASVCSRHGLHDMFREIVHGLIGSKKKPAELCLEDIYLELVWDYVETNEYDAAIELIDRFEEKFPSEKRAALRVRGLVLMARGQADKARQLFAQIGSMPFNAGIPGFEQDRSFRDTDRMSGVLEFEVGYSLLKMKMYPQSLQFFELAKNRAQLNNDHELIMEIDNAQALVKLCQSAEEGN